MSWNVTGTGSKGALIKAVDKYLDPLIKNYPETTEYAGAKSALHALLDSMPDIGLYVLESHGSMLIQSYDGRTVSANAKIELKSINVLAD